MRRLELAAAAGVGIVAWVLYRATMLPGMDLGDTPSFQARVGWMLLTPRDGYPLYSAIGTLVHLVAGGDPARALNLASVAQAALACAVIVLVGVELTGSIGAAIGAALLFAGSYTFWSQAVIAEVYALHLLFVAAVLLLALRWERHPSPTRFAWLLALYGISFGHHLSMILLLPGLVFVLVAGAPNGWRSLVAPPVVLMAAGFALLGALPYLWNLSTLWLLPDPPGSVAEGLRRFWFDVTKSDWRETMVLKVPRSMVVDHAAMYAFDLRQQFGWAAAVAGLGLLSLARSNWRRAGLLAAVYLPCFLFAFGYNVGDTHVFYLPSHLIVALLAAAGVAAAGDAVRRPRVVAALLIGYAAVRIWNDFPALDRSRDDRPLKLIAALTEGLDDRHAVLLADLDWQVQNGLSYFGKERARHVAYDRLPAVILYAPTFIADNAAIDRRIVLTERARAALADAYGPLYEVESDPLAPAPSVVEAVEELPEGTRYVMCLLKTTREFPLDWNDIGGTLSALQNGGDVQVPDGDYIAIAGIVGRRPELVIGSNRPFRQRVVLDGVPVLIRMESWLSADTIRRMGFGHVIAARHHALIVERGVSFVALDPSGQPIQTAYASNIFAPQRRYLIKQRGSPR